MTWTHKKIRRTFLDYFADHTGLPHREVEGSPLIPRDDPTLLFCNAGMNQFKLTGKRSVITHELVPYKSVRGKHNDLDAVGKNGRHLTPSRCSKLVFGDYYKEAIRMSWDLSVNVFGLDAEQDVSVYKDDDKSYDFRETSVYRKTHWSIRRSLKRMIEFCPWVQDLCRARTLL